MNDQQRNQAIANYSRENLSPTPEQRSRISERYSEVSTFLRGSCFMAGSYARFTAVRPPKDLDIIWVCADAKLTEEPRRILQDLARELVQAYELHSSEHVKIEVQEHSITVVFLDDPDEFSIDVVPSARMDQKNEFGDAIYCVPEIQKLSHSQRKSFSGRLHWILSDPKGYIAEASALEGDTNGRFRKAAKVIKAWRQKHKIAEGDAFKLKSFHAEQLVVKHLRTHPTDSILATIRAVFAGLDLAIDAPAIPDRADESVFIDQYVADLSPAEKAKILRLQGEAFDIVTRLENAPDEGEVNDLLDQLTKADIRPPASVAPAVIIARPPQPYAGNRGVLE